MRRATIGQQLHADLTNAISRSWVIMLQGEQPHCGFPEKNYHHNAERLARAGLKVVVVEQTETPDQLRIRNEERKANKQNQVGASPLLQHFPCSKVVNVLWSNCNDSAPFCCCQLPLERESRG